MRWEEHIWDEIRRMQRQIDRLFRESEESRALIFKNKPLDNNLFDKYRRVIIDWRENDKNYIIAAEIPGVDKKDIHLEIVDNDLIIKAEKKEEKEKGEKEKGDYMYTRNYTGFYQEVALPKNADLDNMDAMYKNGILKITIPKKQLKLKKKEIQIK